LYEVEQPKWNLLNFFERCAMSQNGDGDEVLGDSNPGLSTERERHHVL
jgi:hypothetical protein